MTIRTLFTIERVRVEPAAVIAQLDPELAMRQGDIQRDRAGSRVPRDIRDRFLAQASGSR